MLTPKQEVQAQFFGKRGFNPVFLKDHILEKYDILTINKDIHVYQDGVYVPNQEGKLRKEMNSLLGDEARPRRMNDTIKLIQAETFLPPEKVNPLPHILNFQNCCYDLHKDQPVPHKPAYHQTIQIPVEYDESASPDKVGDFLNDVLPKDCISTAFKLFGYCLTPYTFLQKAVCVQGLGANGKTTFLRLLTHFIGESNCSHISLHQLSENRFAGYDLFGKLVNIYDDLEERAVESTSLFKTITGEYYVRAEEKYRPAFNFKPHAKFLFSANEMPKSADRSYAYYRRWLILPFPNTFTGKNRDPDILEKITTPEELSGLLNVALNFLEKLMETKQIDIPESAEEAMDTYKALNDNVMAFVDDTCQLDEDQWTVRTHLFNDYCEYCEDMDFHNVSKRQFYRSIENLPEVATKQTRIDGKRKRVFVGIRQMESTLF